MDSYSDILRYMGHKGRVEENLEAMISLCLEKLKTVSEPRHVMTQLPCEVNGNSVMLGELEIKSYALASRLEKCSRVYIFAATLGADVDRLITQRTKIDSAEALCLQACAAAQIEDYCDSIEKKLSSELIQQELTPRPRFSPGYCDFDITHQTDVLRILQAHKRIGLGETKTHMLTPLKSVTAVIGAGRIEQ